MELKLSLVIPAYNEETRILSPLQEAQKYLDESNLTYEIIVVDDGSSDNTCKVITDNFPNVRLIRQDNNKGKGAAVRRGMLEAKGEICLFSDADFSTPIYELQKVLKTIPEKAEIFVGSRALDYSMIKEHQPWHREFMGKTYNKFVQAIVLKGIKDTQCGFKAFTKEAAVNVFSSSKIDGFGFDIEALYLARKMGYTLAEVPVEWYNDERSTVSPIKDSLRMFFELFKIKRLHNHSK